MYNDENQCTVEPTLENKYAPLKEVIYDCYKKSGEMIEQCLVVSSDMFGDDFPKFAKKDPEPQTLLQTAMYTANRLTDLQAVLNALWMRTLG